MNPKTRCRCCLSRPPDKDIQSMYTYFGKNEIYGDMLKECFKIHLSLEPCEAENGICEVCVARLRDACDFKQQVLRCQEEFQIGLTTVTDIKDEDLPRVKEEFSDPEDNEIYFIEFKDDYEDLKDDDKMAEILQIEGTKAKRKVERKKNGKKRQITVDKNIKDEKPKKINISIRTLSQLERFNNEPSIQLISENKKHLMNTNKILKYSNCTPFFTKTLSGIVCAYCKATYQNLKELKLHTHEVHKVNELYNEKKIDRSNLSLKVDITDLQCIICHKDFDVISNLKQHLAETHDIKFYPDVNDYILEFKLTDGELLNCALCHSKFETFKMLLQHMNRHYRNYVCEVCDMGFINKNKLKNHQRIHEIGTFQCKFCEKVFSTRVRKECHEKYTHKSSSRYTTNCPHCDQSFNSYYRRNRHMFQEHNIAAATYKCNICDKTFMLKSKLTFHIKKVHLMERNHICSECGQGFFIKQSLDEHMIKHNGERVFSCTVCNKAYARKKTLREHMRIHNNDRRFKCGVCSLAFVQKCTLKSHMVSNHGMTLMEYDSGRCEVVCS